jgi:hypothetical protein
VRASLITGGDFDYIKLEAETVAECGQLVAIGVSKFPRYDVPDRVVLCPSPAGVVLEMRVSGLHRATKEERALVNAEHDATS